MTACPRCGEENPERARFCWACGAPLVAEAAPEREVRKTVTIVFTDVIGSTSLGESRDPESMRRVMSRYFEEARRVHERHGGTVEKFIGDAVMAVFGIPTLHEDDALRAVRAAWEMSSRLAELNEELERDWGTRIEVRTGVNTGEVVAGDAAGGQAFATGDAVNVAKRFEQAARPGEILLGEATYRLVRDAVTVEPVEELALKGKTETIAAYRLLEVGEEARAPRLHAPMVGREHERTLLEQAYARVVRERACHLFTLLGPAGVGKSRLATEVVDSISDEATVLVGRCLPYGEGITFWPIAEIVRQAAGLHDDDSTSQARTKIHSLLGDFDDAATIGDRVAHAVGLPAMPASSEETFWGVRKFLEGLARRRPLVVIFDDGHWAEPTFLDLVEHVADWARDAPILLLCLARPELLDERPGWGGGKLNSTSILLEPLSDEESGILVENLLGRTGLPAPTGGRITEAAEGNPLFVEEMLRMLIDDGLLRRQNGHWIAEENLGEVSVPPTIQALLAARLDRLGVGEREVIERAAIEGKVFHRGAVLELASEGLGPEVTTHLLTLQRKEFIRPSRSAFAGEDAFRFRHLLIRDAAYEAIPKRLRAELHARFAVWLERASGERAREYDEIIGHHFEQAYRYRLELGPVDDQARRLARLAGDRLGDAARRARDRDDMTAARSLLERAVALYPPDDSVRLALLPELGDVLDHLGDFAAAEAALSEAIDRAEATGNRGTAAYAQIVLVRMRMFSDPEGRGDEALRVAEEATQVFRELGDSRGVATAAHRLQWVRFQRGQITANREALDAALPHAMRSGDRRLEADIRTAILGSHFWDDTPLEEVNRHAEQLLAWARDRGLRSTERWLLALSAVSIAMSGRLVDGRERLKRAAEVADDLGQTVDNVMSAAEWGGYFERLAGDPAGAERLQRQGYEILESLGEKGFRSTLAGELGQSLYDLGRYSEAESFAEESRKAAASDDLTSQFLWRSIRAKVLARKGEFAEAERLARDAVGIIGQTEYINHHAWALTDLAEVLRLAGRAAEAVEAAREALELYEKKGNVVMAGSTRELLTELAAA